MCSKIYGLDPDQREAAIARLAKPDDAVVQYEAESGGKGTTLFREIHSFDHNEEYLKPQFDTAREMWASIAMHSAEILTSTFVLVIRSSARPPQISYGAAT